MSRLSKPRYCDRCKTRLITPDLTEQIAMELDYREAFPDTWSDDERCLLCDVCMKVISRQHEGDDV